MHLAVGWYNADVRSVKRRHRFICQRGDNGNARFISTERSWRCSSPRSARIAGRPAEPLLMKAAGTPHPDGRHPSGGRWSWRKEGREEGHQLGQRSRLEFNTYSAFTCRAYSEKAHDSVFTPNWRSHPVPIYLQPKKIQLSTHYSTLDELPANFCRCTITK